MKLRVNLLIGCFATLCTRSSGASLKHKRNLATQLNTESGYEATDENVSYEASTETPACGTCSTTKIKDDTTWTFKDGLGDSPGVPNLEFLGAGYDNLRGNPRGSSLSEIDPGFRHRVVKLIQSQESYDLTVDQEYTVPLGTEVRYVSSCKYDSVATEISSQRDYQFALAQEASTKTSINVGMQYTKPSISAQLDVGVAWSKSEKSQKFSSTSTSQNTISFESKVLCTEFEAKFNPYAGKRFDSAFLVALEGLPSGYDAANNEHKAKYSAFLEAYGTHYVDQVVLGGKKIYSTSLSSRDVMELTRDKVDVKDTLSVDVQLALGQPGYVKDAMSDDNNCGTIINNYKKSDDDKKETGVSGNVKFNYDSFSANQRQSESAEKISSKKYKVSEVNIGGIPSEDENWKTWAATIRERPMPVSYKLVGLWEVMNSTTQKDDFFKAVQDIEGISLTPPPQDNVILDALHFGVSGSKGEVISSYSLNPSANYRALLQLDVIPTPKSENQDPDEMVIYQSSTGNNWEAWKNFPKGYYACGAIVKYDEWSGTNDLEGITEIEMYYCNPSNWGKMQNKKQLGPSSSEGTPQSIVMCPDNYFVDGARVRYCDGGNGNLECPGSDPLGIYALQISCSKDGNTQTRVEKTVFCDADYSVNDDCVGQWQPWKYVPKQAPENTRYYITGGTVKFGPSNRRRLHEDDVRRRLDEDLAIESLKFQIEAIPNSGVGPVSDVLTYSAVWENPTSTVTPVFAQTIRGDIAPNTDEDENEFGFIESSIGGYSGGNMLQIENNILFGFETDSYKAMIGVTNFKSDLDSDDTRDFSFLAADNLPSNEFFVSGLVHPKGYPMNEVFGDIGFTVMKNSKREYVVQFTKPFKKPPTFIAFPQWITAPDDTYPSNIGELALVINGACQISQCKVRLGSKQSESTNTRKHLGFNFLALDGDLSNTAVVHGYVDGAEMQSHDPHGFSVGAFNLNKKKSITTKYGQGYKTEMQIEAVEGGVPIKFDKPFSDIPSVIITPIVTGTNMDPEYLDVDKAKIPSCIVEHLIEESVYVKCGWIETVGSKKYTPMSFYLVAVGPP